MNNINEPAAVSPRFRGQVIQKIYRVWLWRKLLPVLIGEIVVISLLLYELGRAVFVERILDNALTVFFANPPQIFSFLTAAFIHTSTLAKILILTVAILVALILRHITQGILRFILAKKNYFAKIKPGDENK